MRRRRVIAGLVVLAAAGATVVAVWPRAPRPCLATFEQVREGMTRDEVIATVGGSPTTAPVPSLQQKLGITVLRDEWRADDGMLRVVFDADNRAEFVAVYALPRPKTRWGRLRANLGL